MALKSSVSRGRLGLVASRRRPSPLTVDRRDHSCSEKEKRELSRILVSSSVSNDQPKANCLRPDVPRIRAPAHALLHRVGLGTGEMALIPNKSASRRRGLQICAILAELCGWARRKAHDQLLERDLPLLSSECLTGSNSDSRSAALPWRSEAFGAPRRSDSPVAPTQSAARASAFESRASSSSWLRSSLASTCPDHRHLS
jgi:hypothetical protein